MEENIRIEVDLHITSSICLHSLKDGKEEWLDEDEFNGVKQYDGKTYVEYYTGWEDCLYEGFYVKETPEEVLSLLKEARDKLSDSYKRYKIVETK